MVNSKKRRKIRLNARGKAFLAGFCIIIILVAAIIIGINKAAGNQNTTEGSTLSSYASEQTLPSETVLPSPTPTPAPSLNVMGSIYSNEAILIDAETGVVLDEKNPDSVAFPASVTKMMTLLIACEQISDYDEVYPLPREIYDTLYYQDLSTAGFECNEPITINDLLYGLQLRSGAECCLGLANRVSGTEAAFVELMNQRAAELGMTNTHFMNCTGEHDANHYSTVRDMAILLQAGLQNAKFREVFTTNVYQTTPTVTHPGGLIIYSTLSQTMSTMDFEGGTILGGKTGYTSEAGQCLASVAKINGHEYILVTFGAYRQEGDTSSHLHTVDAINTYQALAGVL
ncbi:MAG: D-alanyl-D-alanine carboxypeptidase [Clostridiales bacterium]|nr:D-alanyl-D-alanine carboxypeptidase [Clostridiales bacterium]